MRAPILASSVVVAIAAIGACIPHPSGDFEDYGERTQGFNAPVDNDGGGGFDGAPPTVATEGLYYGACLSQLAFGQPNLVFNFYTKTKFVPDGAGGRLSLSIEALKLEPDATGKNGPPAKVSAAGVVGGVMQSVESPTPNVEPDTGRYSVSLGNVLVPGTANPISGSDVQITDAKLNGRFAKERFCAQLNGQVVRPVQLTLEPPRNICQFVPVKDGDPRPPLTAPDFASCPY